MNRSLNTGAALRCDRRGNIISVLHNDLDFVIPPESGTPLSNLTDFQDLSKWLNFILEVQQNGACYGWTINFRLKGEVAALHTGAVVVGEELLVVVAVSQATAEKFLEEMILINNEQTNLIRASAKKNIQSTPDVVATDDEHFDQLSKLNNELVNMQRELAKKNMELAKLNELKNHFLGMAAHDLRNPIGVVMNFSELMLDEKESLSETQLFCLQHISETADFMLGMVNDLLDISYIESGKMVLNQKQFNLVELISKCQNFNSFFANKKNISLRFIPVSERLMVNADEGKIEQVLNNLISNAIKYSFPNSTVEVLLSIDQHRVICEVRDQGQGIPESFLPKLFRPFEKSGKKTTGGEKSTGLGLSIVRKILEAHQGKVWASSIEGKGSSFFFALPLAF